MPGIIDLDTGRPRTKNWISNIGVDLIDGENGLICCEMNGSGYGLKGAELAYGIKINRFGSFVEWIRDMIKGRSVAHVSIRDNAADVSICDYFSKAIDALEVPVMDAKYHILWTSFVDRITTALEVDSIHSALSVLDTAGLIIFPTPVGDAYRLLGEDKERGLSFFEQYLEHPYVAGYHKAIMDRVYIVLQPTNKELDFGLAYSNLGNNLELNSLDPLLERKDLQKVLHPDPITWACSSNIRDVLDLTAGNELAQFIVKPINGMCGQGCEIMTPESIERMLSYPVTPFEKLLEDYIQDPPNFTNVDFKLDLGVIPNDLEMSPLQLEKDDVIVEKLIKPVGERVRVLRLGLALLLFDDCLGIFHISSYWRLNPHMYDGSKKSVVTNLSRDAIPMVVKHMEKVEIARWIERFAKHLGARWEVPVETYHNLE